MHKTDTVKDLKLKIYKFPPFTSPIYQRLWLGELELTNEMTVDELSLGEGSVVDLLVFDEDEGKADWTDVEMKEVKEGKRKREEGFGGTGLLGGWDEEPNTDVRLGYDGKVVEVQQGARGSDLVEEDAMDIDRHAGELSVIPPYRDAFSPEPPSPKKIKTAAPASTRKGKPNISSSLFGIDTLTSVPSGSKRAARAARAAAPVAETPGIQRAEPPTSGRTDFSQMELDDPEAALAAAIAASKEEVGGEGGGEGGRACPACTFVNEAGVGECDMCGGRL